MRNRTSHIFNSRPAAFAFAVNEIGKGNRVRAFIVTDWVFNGVEDIPVSGNPGVIVGPAVRNPQKVEDVKRKFGIA